MKINELLTEAAKLMFKGKELDYKSMQVDGIDTKDAPDFSDAYISYAEYKDGTELTDEELDELMDSPLGRDLTYELVQDHLY